MAAFMQRQQQFREVIRRRNETLGPSDVREAARREIGPHWECFSRVIAQHVRTFAPLLLPCNTLRLLLRNDYFDPVKSKLLRRAYPLRV